MPRPRSLSAVIFLDKNAEYNGALMVIPGSHRSYLRCPGRQTAANWEKSLQSQVYGTPSEEHIRALAESLGIKHCTGHPGDVLLFDSNLLHASSGNRSPFPRRNLFVAFNAWSNRLQAPFYSEEQRPEHVAHRERVQRFQR
ncbi:Ectoine dioxygenase (Ectoine hydroxylase) [Durusdinium trenchii]